MKGIIGKKLGMTRLFNEDGTATPVTVIEAGPCVVTNVKTKERDGYEAVQLGFEKMRRKTATMPYNGQFAKHGLAPRRRLVEFRVDDPGEYQVGQEVTVGVFETGDVVDVTGWSKGRGFQGVVKRLNFSIGRRTHGNKNRRAPGSIGASATPARVWKGTKLPGRMGGGRVTIKRLDVVQIDAEKNLLLVRGAVPGASDGYVLVRKSDIGK
jgi:large subunit ribosomal protein L3